MVSVPPFLLKRLYVKGSLRNNDDGFQFELKNTLGSGYGSQILPVVLDGNELPAENSYFVVDSQEVPFTDVGPDRPFTLAMNKTLRILVRGVRLPEGPHRIGFGFVAQGLGKLGFEVSDIIAGS